MSKLMKYPALFVIVFGLCGCMETSRVASPDGADALEVIKGTTWISDKAETVKWIQRHRPNLANSEKFSKFQDIFGKMTIRYTNDSVTLVRNGKSQTGPHTFLGQTTREVCFRTHDDLMNRDVIIILEIDEDQKGYWIYNNMFDIKEHFVPEKVIK